MLLIERWLSGDEVREKVRGDVVPVEEADEELVDRAGLKAVRRRRIGVNGEEAKRFWRVEDGILTWDGTFFED
jgi:hypothetical protein